MLTRPIDLFRRFRQLASKTIALADARHDKESSAAVTQKTLIALYRQQYLAGLPPLRFADAGFRLYSQHDEDGIILLLFALIGTTNKRCVELCAGDGIECNTSNLLINHRWQGLLVDGNRSNIDRAQRFYAEHPDTRFWSPTIVHSWITRDNVDALIRSNGFSGEIDLLSLDIDGVDYWLWERIECISPRVIVLEFNHLWGPVASVTVPYSDSFIAEFSKYGSDYAGASLQAFVKLGRRKGYRLVGVNDISTNAFFIREDIACNWLPEVSPAVCFDHPRAQFGMRHRLPLVRTKAWVEV